MKQEDATELDQYSTQLTQALYSMQEVRNDSQKPNYTVDTEAYRQYQEEAQQAIVDMMQLADEVADTTDEFTTTDGTIIQLPRAGLSRDIDNMPVMPE